MKDKHIKARVKMCIALSELSNCPRRKFGALLIDPVRNQVLGEGYNGAPRGGGELCGGSWCHRDGLTREDIEVEDSWDHRARYGGSGTEGVRVARVNVKATSETLHMVDATINDSVVDGVTLGEKLSPDYKSYMEDASDWADEFAEKYPPIKSGTHMEIGCHHAEMNVICNAAASSVSSQGAWLIVTGEPCMMCSKLIHHAGIAKVMVVGGGYMGANGVEYLKNHGVEIQVVEGPQDPRLAIG